MVLISISLVAALGVQPAPARTALPAEAVSSQTTPQQTPAPQPAPAPTIAGKWILALEIQGTTATPSLDLKVDGEKVTGFYEGRYGKFPLSGTIKKHALQFTFTMNADGTEAVMAFAGEVAADFKTIKGTANMEGMGEVNWSAKRPEK
jgi:hypothetical protein